MKKLSAFLLAIFAVILLAACGGNGSESDTNESADTSSDEQTEEKTKITFGATTGPYSDMVNRAIKPLLEEKGYEVENVEFSDYIQPNNALHNGDIEANLFQHKIYYEAFAEENNMDLSELIVVPTAPMG